MLGALASDTVAPAPLGGLADAELLARYVECRRRERQSAAEGAAVLAEIDRRASFAGEGFLSPVAFVAYRCGDTHQAAAGRVRVARALRVMPHTAAAFAAGSIDTARVRHLMDAREAAPDRFERAEAGLVDRACVQDAATFNHTVGIWRQNAAMEQCRVQEREQFARRRITITDTFDGMAHLDADLDRASAETIVTAIGALAGPANRDGGDGRTPTQRRVDALTEICRRYLDSGDAPITGGQRPHLNVTVDLDALTGGTATRSQINHRHLLGPAAREALACDATICGVLIDGPHEVLTMGRRVRTATPAQHRALALRDGGCVVPGCDRLPEWCDAHHLIPWVEGGATDIDEMCLVCRPHHLMHHLGTLQLPRRE